MFCTRLEPLRETNPEMEPDQLQNMRITDEMRTAPEEIADLKNTRPTNDIDAPTTTAEGEPVPIVEVSLHIQKFSTACLFPCLMGP